MNIECRNPFKAEHDGMGTDETLKLKMIGAIYGAAKGIIQRYIDFIGPDLVVRQSSPRDSTAIALHEIGNRERQ